LEKHDYTWPNFLQDRGKTITDQLGISGFPTYLILDKTGKILEMNSSFSNVLKWFKLD
jgi:protein-disulfide isomerase-like protein with CxxC motif